MSKTLIIDPGHGGTDPGAIGFGVNEKDWTLKISLYQYNRLKDLGANVAITRTTDRSLDSGPRTDLIKGKYDYCMSNHFNAFNGSARGVETIHSIHSNGAVAKRLADVIVATSKLPLRRVFDRKGKAGDYYFMHRLTGSTSTIIVEYGFIDNKTDHDFYKNESNFLKVAEAVVKEWCSILGIKYTAPGSKPPVSKPTPAPKQDPTPAPKSKTISQMAAEVIAGQHGNGHANRRKTLGISQAEYNKVRAEVNRRAGGSSASKPTPAPKKSVSQMAQEVINGKHGNGHAARRSSLGITQAEYNKVRAEVNKRAGSGSSAAPKKSISQMAAEVIRGDHGNGHAARRSSLGISQAEYNKVRAEVNKRM